MSYLSRIMQPVWLRPKPHIPVLNIYSSEEADVIQYLADNLCNCHQSIAAIHPYPVPFEHATDCRFTLFVNLMVRLQDYHPEEEK